MTEYEKNKRILVEALETYREPPPDDGKRRFVDWLMERSLQAAQNDPIGKKYHNLFDCVAVHIQYETGQKTDL